MARCVLLGAALLAAALAIPAELRALEAEDGLDGVWSKDLDTCSLSDDEDETRLAIENGEMRDYAETCRIVNRSLRQDRSVLVKLQCSRGGRGTRTMRVFPTSDDRAVFYLPENKRPRSRDLIRCPPTLPEVSVLSPELSEKLSKPRGPRSLIKLWLDARGRCRSQVSTAREEACAERRHIGSMLRATGLCHYTRGSREGWRACS